mmetsp:Transcript_8936/g.27035  ORF Transcript_8936/g.27035 Transcript_8936/m.27035 type:complete len:238 (+) Transcript_8936:43-756(+)
MSRLTVSDGQRSLARVKLARVAKHRPLRRPPPTRQHRPPRRPPPTRRRQPLRRQPPRPLRHRTHRHRRSRPQSPPATRRWLQRRSQQTLRRRSRQLRLRLLPRVPHQPCLRRRARRLLQRRSPQVRLLARLLHRRCHPPWLPETRLKHQRRLRRRWPLPHSPQSQRLRRARSPRYQMLQLQLLLPDRWLQSLTLRLRWLRRARSLQFRTLQSRLPRPRLPPSRWHRLVASPLSQMPQ